MREVNLSLPEIFLIAGTRATLGAGAGLLLAGKLNKKKRRAVGLALLLVGIASTFPLMVNVMNKCEIRK
jgi:hypothetical protein